MKRVVRGAIGILTLSFLLTGCGSRVENAFIEGEFYSDKPFGSAGTNTVLPPKLDRVDLFSHIARGDYCVHYRILTGVDFSDVPPTPPQASNWTISGLLAKITGGGLNPSQTDIDVAKGRATALEAQSTAEARAKRCKDEVERLTATATDSNFSVSQRLARAYDEFARSPGKAGEFLTGEEQRQRRGQIQDEVLRASEQRCNTYKLYLQTIQSNASFLSGSASTILGGLGAIFTDSGVSRALAGAAGISAGVGAQFQESYFMSLAVPAISEGIDNARQTIFNQIAQQRKSDIHLYTLQNALLDAVRYDGACSIPRGLQEVADAARNIRTPGAFVMQRAIEQFTQARQSLNTLASVEVNGGAASAVFGTAGADQEIASFVDQPTQAVGKQIEIVRSYALSVDAAMTRLVATAPSDYDANVKLARDQLIAARDYVITNLSALSGTAHTIEVDIVKAQVKIADAKADIDAKNTAIAELNSARGKSRSEVIAPLQGSAATFLSAADSVRILSFATTKSGRNDAVCHIQRAFGNAAPSPGAAGIPPCPTPAAAPAPAAAPVAPVIQGPLPPPAPAPAPSPGG